MPRWVTGSDGRRYQTSTDIECDRAYFEGTAMSEAEQAERIRMAENSPEQRDWDHDDACESEFITEAGMYSPCQCKDRANEDQEPLEDGIDRNAL